MLFVIIGPMEYQTLIKPELDVLLPGDFTSEEKLINSARNAANWLECASLEQYSPELRAAWRQRGKDWLDFAGRVGGVVFTSQEHIWALGDHLDRANSFWDATKVLETYCRSHTGV